MADSPTNPSNSNRDSHDDSEKVLSRFLEIQEQHAKNDSKYLDNVRESNKQNHEAALKTIDYSYQLKKKAPEEFRRTFLLKAITYGLAGVVILSFISILLYLKYEEFARIFILVITHGLVAYIGFIVGKKMPIDKGSGYVEYEDAEVVNDL